MMIGCWEAEWANENYEYALNTFCSSFKQHRLLSKTLGFDCFCLFILDLKLRFIVSKCQLSLLSLPRCPKIDF